MKKSELEQIIKEEIQAVLLESVPDKKKWSIWKRMFYVDPGLALQEVPILPAGLFHKALSYFARTPKVQKIAKAARPRNDAMVNRILFGNRIKKIQVKQPVLDNMGFVDDAKTTFKTMKPGSHQDEAMRNLIDITLAPSRGYFYMLDDMLRKVNPKGPGFEPWIVKIPDDLAKAHKLEDAKLILKHTGKANGPLKIEASIVNKPWNPKTKRFEPETVPFKSKKTKMSYPGDGPGMDLIPVSPNARGRTMPPPPRPTSGKAKIVNKRLENKQLDTSKDT